MIFLYQYSWQGAWDVIGTYEKKASQNGKGKRRTSHHVFYSIVSIYCHLKAFEMYSEGYLQTNSHGKIPLPEQSCM